MKRFLIVLMLLTFISPIFARTVQCVKKYQVYQGYRSTYDVTSSIQSMIDIGWKVISITPISKEEYNAAPTDYVIVLFEKEE